VDERYRRAERAAIFGDEAAQLRLNYLGCRMGHHVLQTEQILLSDNWQRAEEDAGCCQCGKQLYTARQLCEMGHHRLRYDPWSHSSVYYCVRPHWTQQEIDQLLAQATRLEQELAHIRDGNPYKVYGCPFRLEADEACARGLHFLHITLQGRECRNPNCSYSEADACPHNIGWSLHRDAEGEVARCGRCQMAFYNEGICGIFGHRPDDKVQNPCMCIRCPAYKRGTNLYEALAAAYRAGHPLTAICREEGRTIAEASGWSEKLRAFGVKKPKMSERTKSGIRDWLGRPSYRIRVRWTTWNGRQQQGEDYSNITENLKTRWAGHWYNSLPQLAEVK
jgi:hypothetical protein